MLKITAERKNQNQGDIKHTLWTTNPGIDRSEILISCFDMSS